MGCCLGIEGSESPVEGNPLISPQNNFRLGRNAEHFGEHKTAKKILQCVCTSLCLWKPSGWGLIGSSFLALICVFQLVYDLFVVCGCPEFDCGFLEKPLVKKTNNTLSFRKTSNTVYTLASIGGLFSYTLLLISLMLMRRRRRHDNKAVGPADTLNDDLSNRQIKLIFLSQVILTVLFLSAVGLFYYLVRNQPKHGWHFYLLILGVAAQFTAQWAAIVGCHVFAISSLALGTLADDTIRRIRQMEIRNPQQMTPNDASTDTSRRQEVEQVQGGGPAEDGTGPRAQQDTTTEQDAGRDQSKIPGGQTTHPERIEQVTPHVDYGSTSTNMGQNVNQNKFDIAVRYHEELCAIVSDTVSAYCPWFVMHWFFYGATCLIGVIYISEELTTNPKHALKLAYVIVFLVTHIYMFLFPCCCAAYITDTCGGIYSRINKTTSDYWTTEGHPFKERVQLMMFTAYTKDRQCVFKIGRLTFTSTLAWISLLLGSTGLLFHFF